MARKKKKTKKAQKRLRTLLWLLLIALLAWAIATGKINVQAFLPTDTASSSVTDSSTPDSSTVGDSTDIGTTGGVFTDGDITAIKDSDLSIHFPELGNKYTGDCTLIKVGNTEILIDAGSRKGSAETLVPYINQFCTDGTLEYVIATHAHQDHIAGFVGTKSAKGIFESCV